MAHNHPLSTPFQGGQSPGQAQGLDAGLVDYVALCYATAAEVQALDLTGKNTNKIIVGTSVFDYDASDTTSAHDGVTVLVTLDGKRFKNTGTRVNGTVNYAVDDRDLTAPPASPAEGDSYLIPAAPTGEWAGFAKHVTVYVGASWVFIAPRRAMQVYIADEAAYVHYDGADWIDGLGNLIIPANSIKSDRLEQPYGWRVEAEQHTPPGSIPGAGVLYIVGASATGDWSGEDGNIARSTGAAWEFVTAAEGMTVFNKALGYNVSFKSGNWQVDRVQGVLLFATPIVVATPGSIPNNQWYTFLTMGSRAVDQIANDIRARGAVLLDRNPTATTPWDGTVSIGLFVNTESTPRDSISFDTTRMAEKGYIFFEFAYQVPDTVARDYFVKIFTPIGSSSAITQASAVLEELNV